MARIKGYYAVKFYNYKQEYVLRFDGKRFSSPVNQQTPHDEIEYERLIDAIPDESISTHNSNPSKRLLEIVLKLTQVVSTIVYHMKEENEDKWGAKEILEEIEREIFINIKS